MSGHFALLRCCCNCIHLLLGVIIWLIWWFSFSWFVCLFFVIICICWYGGSHIVVNFLQVWFEYFVLVIICICWWKSYGGWFSLGTPVCTIIDEFLEKFQKGGGHFQSKKNCCKIFSIRDANLGGLFRSKNFRRTKSQHFSQKRGGGGGQRPFGTFPKIHRYWYRQASLTYMCDLCWC